MVKSEEFARVWNESSSLDEIANKLSMKKASVSVRASMLRKKGVELKYFRERKLQESNNESVS